MRTSGTVSGVSSGVGSTADWCASADDTYTSSRTPVAAMACRQAVMPAHGDGQDFRRAGVEISGALDVGEVDHRVAALSRRGDRLHVADIGDVHLAVQAVEAGGVPAAEVVQDDYLMPFGEEPGGERGADEPGPAQDAVLHPAIRSTGTGVQIRCGTPMYRGPSRHRYPRSPSSANRSSAW